MDLVTATKLATRRVLTPGIIQEYRVCIERYLRTLRILFPHRRISPNQHLAVHLPKALADFGPTHAWRCFPFERYNYILQQINTNAKSGKTHLGGNSIMLNLFEGEMEVTMFERFCMMQNLRALMQFDLPSEVLDLQARFLNVFGPDYGGTALNDLWASDVDAPQYHNTSKRKSLDKETWALLKQWFVDKALGNHAPRDVLFQRSVKKWNMRFSTRVGRTHNGDSNIVWGNPATDSWHAGRIRSIFVWPGEVEQIFLVVDQLKAKGNTSLWQRYRSSAAGRIFEDKVSGTRILRLDEVACHSAVVPFAFGPAKQPCLHVLPLERVSPDTARTKNPV